MPNRDVPVLRWVRPPQQARSQETLHRILDAAEVLVAEKSFEDASVSEIVRRANSSVGAFYARFEDKDAVLRVLLRLLPRVRGRVPLTALVGVAAWASVMLAAGAFVIEYALGATSDVATSTVATAVLGVHALVGVGEGVITAVVVGTVLAVRPDLVYIGGLLRGSQQLEIRQPTPVVVR